MEVPCWSDYLCPWCYVGQDRAKLLEERGVTVVHLPYELHPEIPAEGRRVRPDGRLEATFDRIEAACAEAGMPFRRPERMPNTRRALEPAEGVRRRHPDSFASLHAALFHAQFATGEPIDDPDVLDRLVAEAGAPAAVVRAAVEAGDASAAVDESMANAREAGVASTPAWSLGEGFVVPGVPDRATFGRWIDRLVSRST
ncbi:MAG: DsbA family protein [Acidimicrobiales bacterium]